MHTHTLKHMANVVRIIGSSYLLVSQNNNELTIKVNEQKFQLLYITNNVCNFF